MTRKVASAHDIAENPQLVYWAHPPIGNQFNLSWPFYDHTILTLHLRNGSDFELISPASEVQIVTAWLREKNPSLRWGAFDEIEFDSTTSGRVELDRETHELLSTIIFHRISGDHFKFQLSSYFSLVVFLLTFMVGLQAAVPAFMICLWFNVRTIMERNRHNQVLCIARNRQLVYWAQPIVETKLFSPPLLLDSQADCTRLKLHLRDGTGFEVGLPLPEMRAYVTWLRETNPTLRWGVGDDMNWTEQTEY